jgi:hypothetical protein
MGARSERRTNRPTALPTVARWEHGKHRAQRGKHQNGLPPRTLVGGNPLFNRAAGTHSHSQANGAEAGRSMIRERSIGEPARRRFDKVAPGLTTRPGCADPHGFEGACQWFEPSSGSTNRCYAGPT